MRGHVMPGGEGREGGESGVQGCCPSSVFGSGRHCRIGIWSSGAPGPSILSMNTNYLLFLHRGGPAAGPKEPPPLGCFFYLAGSLTKNPEEEDSPGSA